MFVLLNIHCTCMCRNLIWKFVCWYFHFYIKLINLLSVHVPNILNGLGCCQITDLLVNITKHVLKPKHQVLTDQEKEKLLKKYSIEEKQVSIYSSETCLDLLMFHFTFVYDLVVWWHMDNLGALNVLEVDPLVCIIFIWSRNDRQNIFWFDWLVYKHY